MSTYKERIKLEAMYYHARDKQHLEFLNNNPSYAWWRTVNTFKGNDGKEIVEGQTIAGTPGK